MTALAVPPHGLNFTRVDIHTQWNLDYDVFREDFAMLVPDMAKLLGGMTNSFCKVDLEQGLVARPVRITSVRQLLYARLLPDATPSTDFYLERGDEDPSDLGASCVQL